MILLTTKKSIVTITGVIFGVFCLILNTPITYAGTYVGTHGDFHSRDIVAIDILLDTEGKTLNAVEGSVSLNGAGYIVKDISVAGSELTIWPRKPSLSTDGTMVTFIGGNPAGLNDGRAQLFTLFVQLGNPGDLTVSYSSVFGYLNDGLGTKVPFKEHSNTIRVLGALKEPLDAQVATVSSDNQPPEPFSVEVLQDPTQNAGMKYAAFETTDKKSGIAYYEVVEGSREAVRSGTNYVLQNQSKNERLVVRAFDKAGNVRVSIYKDAQGFNWVLIAVFAVCLVVIFFLRKKIYVFLKKYAHKK